MVLPRVMRTVVQTVSVAVALTVVGCSGGDGEQASKSSTTTKAAGTATSGAKSDSPAFVDIVECENASGSGTAKGTIENQGTESTAYEYTLAFTDGSGSQIATGSTTTASASPGATVDWVVTADGLGSISTDDLVCRTVSLKPAGGATSPTSAAGASDEEFPCDLLTVDEVAQIAGNPLDGDATTSQVTENEGSWLARVCTWTGPPGTSQEVTLSVSRSGDFNAGESTCPPPMGDTVPVGGIGTKATWRWDDPGTTQKVGELRVCSPAGFVTVQVSGTNNEPQQQAVAKSVAEKALSGI